MQIKKTICTKYQTLFFWEREKKTFKVYRKILKVGQPCLTVLYICVKFCENISDGISVIERTQMMEALTIKILEGIT